MQSRCFSIFLFTTGLTASILSCPMITFSCNYLSFEFSPNQNHMIFFQELSSAADHLHLTLKSIFKMDTGFTFPLHIQYNHLSSHYVVFQMTQKLFLSSYEKNKQTMKALKVFSGQPHFQLNLGILHLTGTLTLTGTQHYVPDSCHVISSEARCG